MPKPKYSLNTPSASIGLLSFFTLGFLVALGAAYHCGAAAGDFKVILGGAFSSFSGALLLALRGGANDHSSDPAPLPSAPPQTQVPGQSDTSA